jgi:hypothetical protein
MAAPGTCSPGYSYFQDLMVGPGVDPSWTISQSGGQNEVTNPGGGDVYNPAIISASAQLGAISQVLPAAPTRVQGNYNYQITYNDASYNTTSTADMWVIRDNNGVSGVTVKLESSGFPVVTTIVKLRVVDNADTPEYTKVLATYVDNSVGFPVTHMGSGTIKVIQAADGVNIMVYHNGTLLFTSTSGIHAFGATTKLQIGRFAPDAHQNLFFTMSGMSFVGPAGLPNNCPPLSLLDSETGRISVLDWNIRRMLPVATGMPFGQAQRNIMVAIPDFGDVAVVNLFFLPIMYMPSNTQKKRENLDFVDVELVLEEPIVPGLPGGQCTPSHQRWFHKKNPASAPYAGVKFKNRGN